MRRCPDVAASKERHHIEPALIVLLVGLKSELHFSLSLVPVCDA